MQNGAIVAEVESNSVAWQSGIFPGDVIVKINGLEMNDWLDYLRFSYESDIDIDFFSIKSNKIIHKKIHKSEGEPLGIAFSSYVFDGIKKCANNCIFCFLKQSVPDLRPTLYIRDDDYRLSFLEGNYITLSNLLDVDLERIAQLKLTPLYISVHCTNEDIRTRMLRPRKTELRPIMSDLSYFSANNIELFVQLVICPGYNDGDVLRQTLRDLKSFANILKVAIVPVGLTTHRGQCTHISPLNQSVANEIIEIAQLEENDFQDVIFAIADEIFLTAGSGIPPSEYYGEFELYENGVGMLRHFIDEFRSYVSSQEGCLVKSTTPNCVILTSVAAYPMMACLFKEFFHSFGYQPIIKAVRNDFWGRSINVNGLLTGVDIIKAITEDFLFDNVYFIADAVFSSDDELTLDGLTLDELKSKTNASIKMISTNAKALLSEFMEGK